jgi:hypothetical protein
LALAGLVGRDVVLPVMQMTHHEFAGSKYRPCPLLREWLLGDIPGGGPAPVFTAIDAN